MNTKRLFSLLLLLGLPAGLVLAGGDPRAVFEGETYNFGTVFQDEKVTHLFKFKNEGKGDLKILDMKTSCGCTAAKKEEKENYAPGESGEIEVVFSVGHAKGDASRTVTVWTNDPKAKQLSLVVAGKIQAGYLTDPEDGYVRFDGAPKGLSQSKTVRVMNPENKPFKILSTKKGQNNPNVSVRTSASPQGGWDVRVSLSSKAPVGRFAEQVVLTTDLQRAATITLPVYADVVGPLEVTPPSVQASFPEGAPQEVPNMIRVKRRDGKPIQVLSASSEAANVKATIRKAQGGAEPAEVEVVIRKADNQSYGSGKVKIKTSDPDQPEVEVNVSWVVPQGPRPGQGGPPQGGYPGGPPPKPAPRP